MLTLTSSAGALYPVASVDADIDIVQSLLPAVSLRSGNGRVYAPYWYADVLARHFGEPVDEYSRHQLELLRHRTRTVAAIKRGEHEWIDHAPPKLFRHQKEVWALCMVAPEFAIFHDPGLGKTVSMIEVIKTLQRTDRGGPTLIIGEPTLLYDTWEPELKEWAGATLEVANLNTNADYAKAPADVFLISRQTFIKRPASLREAMRNLGLRRVILDESSSMKNHETRLPQQLLRDWAQVPERYLLTGLPAPNNELEYWAQMQFIMPGLLPTTFEAYKDEYFESAPDKEYYKLRGRRWILKEDRRKLLTDRLGTGCVFRSQEDCTDIPPPAFHPVHVDLPAKAGHNIRASYEVLEGELRRDLGKLKGAKSRRKAEKALGHVFARIMKIRQLCSGYIVDANGTWRLVSDHKYRLLEGVLQTLGERQAVIWMNFDKDFENVSRLLPERAKKAGFVWGRTARKDYRKDVLDMFRAGELRYLFANPHSIQKGLTLFDPKAKVPCHNAVYFNYDYSLEAFVQSMRRLIRIGQWIPVNIWVLICRHTREEEMYQRLRFRRGDADEVLELLK